MGSRWNPRRTIGLLLVAGSGVLLLADYGRESIAVDRCLDAGSVYDYREGRCRDDVTHRPHIPYAARNPALLAGAGALVICGVGLIVLGPAKQVMPLNETLETVPRANRLGYL